MRFTIKLKLLLAFGFIITMLVGSAFFSVTSIADVNEHWSDTLNGPAARLSAAQDLSIAQLQQVRQQKNILNSTSTVEMERYVLASDKARAEYDETCFRCGKCFRRERVKRFQLVIDFFLDAVRVKVE